MANLQTLALLLDPKLRFAEAETIHDLLTPTERARSGIREKCKKGTRKNEFSEWLALYDDMTEEEVRQHNLGLYSSGSLFIFGPEPEAEAPNYVPRTFRGRTIWLLQNGSKLTKGDRHDGAYMDRAILITTVLSCIIHVSLSDRICENRLEAVEAGFAASWDASDGILNTFYPFAHCSTDETRRRLIAILIFEFLFTALITVEATMKIIAKGFLFHPKSYLRDGWCAFELGVVMLGWMQFFPGQESQAYARVGRLLRPLQFLPRFYGMRKMVENLIPSIRPAGMAIALSGGIILILGLVGMEIFHGDLHSRCVDVGRTISVATDASDYSHLCSSQQGIFGGGGQCPALQICSPYRTEGCENKSSIDPICFYPNPDALFNFDDILGSLMTLGKAVISDDWSRTMRLLQVADSHIAALLYFAVAVFLLSWFMVHLVVAVIRDVYLKSLQLDKIRSTSSRQFESSETQMEKVNGFIQQLGVLAGNFLEIFTTILKTDRLKSQILLWWHEQRSLRRRFRRMRKVLRDFIRLKAFDYSILTVVLINILVMCLPYFSYQQYQDNVCMALSQRLYGSPMCIGPLVSWNRTSISAGSTTLFHDPSGFCRLVNDTGKPCFSSWAEVERKNLTYDNVCGSHCIGMPASLSSSLDNLNIIFTIVFTIEMTMKLFALGPLEYVRSRSNLFDGFIVLTSLVEVSSSSGSGGTTTLRAFRVFRVGRLLRRWPAMKMIMSVVRRVGQETIALTILLFIFIFIAGLAGADLLGGKLHNAVEGRYCQTCQDATHTVGNGTCNPRSCVLQIPRTNFDTFFPGAAGYGAFVSVIAMITREQWSLLAETSYAAGGGFIVVIYFILIEFFGCFLILNIFLVVLVHAYVEISREMREARAARKKMPSSRSWDIILIAMIAKMISVMFTVAKVLRNCFLELRIMIVKRIRKGNAVQPVEIMDAVALTDQPVAAIQEKEGPTELLPSDDKPQDTLPASNLIADLILKGVHAVASFLEEHLQAYQEALCKIPAILYIVIKFREFQQILSNVILTKGFDNMISVLIVCSTIVLLAEDPLLLLSECCPTDFVLIENSSFFKGNRSCVRGLASPEDICNGHGTCLNTGICACDRSPIWYTSEQCQCNWFSSEECRGDWKLIRHSAGYRIFLVLEYIFALIFGLEMVFKIICCGLFFPSLVLNAEGRQVTPYLRDPWNAFDALMVLVTLYAAFAGDSASKGVRGFRGVRCLRPLRMLKRFPGIRMIVLYIMKSTPQVGKMSLVFLALVGLFAVIGLQLFSGKLYSCRNPVNYPLLSLSAVQANHTADVFECLKQGGVWGPPTFTFDSIYEAMVLMLLAAGDHWVAFMDGIADINDIGKNPRAMMSPLSSWYFVLYVFFSQFCLLHAFLAVALDEYMQLKEASGLGFLSRKQVEWIQVEKFKLASLKMNNVRELTAQQKRAKQLGSIANITEDGGQDEILSEPELGEGAESDSKRESFSSGSDATDKSRPNAEHVDQTYLAMSKSNNSKMKARFSSSEYDSASDKGKRYSSASESDKSTARHKQDLYTLKSGGGSVPGHERANATGKDDSAASESDRSSSKASNRSKKESTSSESDRASVRVSASLFGTPHETIATEPINGTSQTYEDAISEQKPAKSLRAKVQRFFREQIESFSIVSSNIVSHPIFDYVMDALIFVELALMLLNSFPPNPILNTESPFIDLAFALIFTSEMGFKVFAFGRHHYWSDRLHRFDAICSILSLLVAIIRISIAAAGFYSGIPGLSCVRAFRMFRILRLFRKEATLQSAYYALIISLPGVLRLFAMMILLWAVYLAVGMPMFYNVRWGTGFSGYIDSNTNFVNFVHSLTTLLAMASGNGWVQIMESSSSDNKDYSCQWDLNWDGSYTDEDGCGGSINSLFYFPSFVFFHNLLVNIVLVFIMDNFHIASDLTIENTLADEAVNEFMKSWRRFDPDKTFLIESRRLRDLLLDMPPPFGFRGQRSMQSCATSARLISPFLKSVVDEDANTKSGRESRRLTIGSVVYGCFKVAFPLTILPSAGIIVAAAKAAYEEEDTEESDKIKLDLLADHDATVSLADCEDQAARVLQFAFAVYVKGSRVLRRVRRMLREKAAFYTTGKVRKKAVGTLISEIIYEYWKKYIHPKPHFAMAEYFGRISVNLVAGKNLPSTGRAGKCDPFAILTCCDEASKSTVLVDTYNPIWEEQFLFDCNDIHGILDVQVYDDDVVKKVLLGEVQVPISTIWMQPGMMMQKWFKLNSANYGGEQDSHVYLDIRGRTYKWVIDVAILGCRKLPTTNIDNETVMHPYATVILGDRTFMTLPKSDTFDPTFDEHFTFFVHDLHEDIRVVICNNQLTDENGDSFVGQATIPLASMLSLRNLYAFPFSGRRLPGIWTGDRWYPLREEEGRHPCAQAVVYIIEGKDLPKMDAFGKIDCFCLVRVVKQDGKLNRAQKTGVQFATFTPKWNQQFVFNVYDNESHLLVELYDYNLDGHSDFVGLVKLELSQFRADSEMVDAWYEVEPVQGKSPSIAGSLGKVRISVEMKVQEANYTGSLGYVHINFEARLIAKIPPIREFLVANQQFSNQTNDANEPPADVIDAFLKISIIEGKGLLDGQHVGYYCSFDIVGSDSVFLGATKIMSGQSNPRWCEEFVAKKIEFNSYVTVRIWSLNVAKLIHPGESSDISDAEEEIEKEHDDLVGFLEIPVFELWSSMQTANTNQSEGNTGSPAEGWQSDRWHTMSPEGGREEQASLRLIFSFVDRGPGHEYDKVDEFASRGILRSILVNKRVNDTAAAERGVIELSKAAQTRGQTTSTTLLLSRLMRRPPQRVTPASAPPTQLLTGAEEIIFQRPLRAWEAAGVTGVALDAVRPPRSVVPRQGDEEEVDPLRYLEQTGRILTAFEVSEVPVASEKSELHRLQLPAP